MTTYADVPQAIVERVRAACAHLPEAYEEEAFAGFRWRIRGRTLAHLVTIVDDDTSEQRTVVWLHAAPSELDALVAMGDPFSLGWDDGLVTVRLRDDGTTDWDELEELVTESYCLLAPKKLVVLLDHERRPPVGDSG